MENELINIKNNAVSLILDSNDPKDLEEIKLQFLGRSGKLTLAMKELPKIDPDKRKEVGILANEVKETIENTLKDKEQQLKHVNIKTKIEKIDVTNPGIRPPLGHLHLITQAILEITDIFERIGFTRVRYPEVEWDWYSFGALNFPENHPARDDWETFFIDEEPNKKFGPMLLTPHTSSGQIREMRNVVESASGGEIPPIKMLNIAKCYRRQSDVSHTLMFHQFETLAIAEKVSITDLKGVLDYFAKAYFGPDRKTRIRPYHFEFTEPSFEVDISCGMCNGQGCKLCKEGWLEMGGAGMVHPNVLKNAGLDPNKYTGFASGWGVERVLMMKEGIEIDDLRLLYSNKLEFLEQF
ncbi:MAG: Phenylalanyl-tRNA synthetase alpha chain (Phenylalanine-tRNA ligase alpha chain) [uncultured bacterium]|nr:MAG: Phenylalanyl-tRNA synthetase alpha chain (Phenylalanine-tRNA ligase alpha chain) [uncultured bacterium]